MKFLFKKIPFVFLLLFGLFLVESCQQQDTIQPAPADQTDASVVQRITDLGFDADEIKDMGTHYLVDGDVYFSKNNIDEEKPGSEPARFDGKYPWFTVRIDNEIAGNDTWKTAVDFAIAAWNADKRQHMHLVLTTSTDAHITIRADNGELTQDVPLASEFGAHGRLGSIIRVNMKYKGSITPEEIKEKMLKALFRTTGCHHPKITASPKSLGAARSAENFSFNNSLYIIRNDQFVRVEKTAGTAYAEVLSEGWQGSTHMIMGGDRYLYIIQYGVLYFANHYDGTWGALSDGWTDTQAMTPSHLNDWLFIIDKNRDLYMVYANSGAKLRMADLGSRGTFRMAGIKDGIAISDSYKNALLFWSFSTGKLTTVANSTTELNGESDPVNWENTAAMVYKWYGGNQVWIAIQGSTKQLLGWSSPGSSFHSADDELDWTGVKTLAYSVNNQYAQFLYYFKNGTLFEWGMYYPGRARTIRADPNYHEGSWQGAYLVACW